MQWEVERSIFSRRHGFSPFGLKNGLTITKLQRWPILFSLCLLVPTKLMFVKHVKRARQFAWNKSDFIGFINAWPSGVHELSFWFQVGATIRFFHAIWIWALTFAVGCKNIWRAVSDVSCFFYFQLRLPSQPFDSLFSSKSLVEGYIFRSSFFGKCQSLLFRFNVVSTMF